MDKRAIATAEALVDLYAVVGAPDAPELEDQVFQPVVKRLTLAEAFGASITEDGGLDLEVTPLLVASTIVTRWLVQRAAVAGHVSEAEVVFDLRSHISRLPASE